MIDKTKYYWKIWYDDGTSVIGSTEEEWNSFPVQGIIQAKEFRSGLSNLIHHGLDYFFFEDGQIISTSNLEIYVIRPQGVKNVKVGRWCNNHIYEQALKEGNK